VTPEVQVQVVNWNRADDTLRCLESVRRLEGTPAHIVVVDNASRDGSAERIAAAFPEAELLRAPVNEGFAGGHNRAFRHGLEKGRRFFFLLNNDAVAAPGALRALLDAAEEDPGRGVLGAWVLAEGLEERLETRGVRLSSRTGRMVHLGFGERPDPGRGPEEVTAVSGCALLIRREVLDRVGLLDPDYFAYFEDLDLCARAGRAGFRVMSVPAARVAHRGKATSGGLESADWIYYAVRNHLLFLERNFPLRPAVLSRLRSLWVIALNLAHVLLRVPVSPPAGARAVFAGVRAFRARRFGART
jgi:GT2 family glycosyltransferase